MATLTAHRSAHGLTADRADPWQIHAACDAVTEHLFFADARGLQPNCPTTDQAKAAHICLNHCPVLAACRRDAERNPPTAVVQGGLAWLFVNSRTKHDRSRPLADAGHGPWCQHLRRAW